MNEPLKKLLELAKTVNLTQADREIQRRSFAYGNTHFENELITREMVDRLADQIPLQEEK